MTKKYFFHDKIIILSYKLYVSFNIVQNKTSTIIDKNVMS